MKNKYHLKNRSALVIFLLILVLVFMPLSAWAYDDVDLPDEDLTPHTHTASATWSYDASYHWHVCTDQNCQTILDKAAHTWDGGTVSQGVIVYKCTVCGATKRLGKANPLKLSTSKKTYKAKALKKSKKTFTVKVTKFKGKVTYSLSDAAKAAKIKVKKKGSSSKAVKYKIIVPKKCKKGIYEVNINAAGGSGYQAGSKTVRIVVK